MAILKDWNSLISYLTPFEGHVKVDKIIFGNLKQLETYLKEVKVTNYVLFVEYPSIGMNSNNETHQKTFNFGFSLMKPTQPQQLTEAEEEAIMNECITIYEDFAAWIMHQYRADGSEFPNVRAYSQDVGQIEPVSYYGLENSIGYRSSVRLSDYFGLTYKPENFA
uniref:hypothetical protein n=1 Tax=Roseivirga sp. TaxID=1964215 RepID=UPI004047FD91